MLLKNLFLCILIAQCHTQDKPVIETPLGTVSGFFRNSHQGKTFAAFEGIPYAQPPTGELRFKEPQEVLPWDGEWAATNIPQCMQEDSSGSEDCLYLNIYSPRDIPTAEDNLDVVVHIHGGGFISGTATLAQPTLVADKDLMLVSINYRLGTLGFLCTMDETIPCNIGMKDQVFALKWIQKYIKYFGGNPASVTITGQSAGAASVHYHYLSPLSKGLFHRGFSLSGNALEPWAFQRNPVENLLKIANAVNCVGNGTFALIDCMRSLPATTLAAACSTLHLYHTFPTAPLGPCVEPEGDGQFLTDKPYNLLNSGQINDVPWLASVTRDEGVVFVLGSGLYKTLDDLNETWDKNIHYIIDTVQTSTDEDKASIGEEIKEHYFGDDDITYENVKNLGKLLTDRNFMSAFQKASLIHSSNTESPVYDFVLAYMGNFSFTYSFQDEIDLKGVSHTDDMQYIFAPQTPFTEEDDAMSKLYLNLLESFVKEDKPQVGEINWAPVSDPEILAYLYIEAPNDFSLRRSKDIADVQFWDSLPLNEYENEL